MREQSVVAASLEPHLSEHAQEQGAPYPSPPRPWLHKQTRLFYQLIVVAHTHVMTHTPSVDAHKHGYIRYRRHRGGTSHHTADTANIANQQKGLKKMKVGARKDGMEV